jgi:hypothetical protein
MHADLRRLGQPTASAFTDADRDLDFTSLAEYLDTRGASPLLRAVVDVAYTTEYGLEIDQQSCLNFLLFIHADRPSKFHPFGVFSDERFHVVEGNQGIADGIVGRLPEPIQFVYPSTRAGPARATGTGNEAPPVGNLFFAGEHTGSFYEQQGFMEGAVQSGQRAAGEVYRLLRR